MSYYFVEFFEECIAEEQFEAQKLDIMRDAVRAKTEYNSIAKSDEHLLKSKLSPPTLPKPAKRKSIESESVVNGCEKSVVENGKEKITINGEIMAVGNDEEMTTSQEITTEDSREGRN